MRDYLPLGPTPWDEECVQVVSGGDYFDAMKSECNRYKELLQIRFHDRPEGVTFAVKTFAHDFGSYCEAAICFDNADESQVSYAIYCERNTPRHWGDTVAQSYSDWLEHEREDD